MNIIVNTLVVSFLCAHKNFFMRPQKFLWSHIVSIPSVVRRFLLLVRRRSVRQPVRRSLQRRARARIRQVRRARNRRQSRQRPEEPIRRRRRRRRRRLFRRHHPTAPIPIERRRTAAASPDSSKRFVDLLLGQSFPFQKPSFRRHIARFPHVWVAQKTRRVLHLGFPHRRPRSSSSRL